MKFNRQKRVAKQLKLAKEKRLKIKRKNIETVAFAAISLFANIVSSKAKNDNLKDAIKFISALSGVMFINSLSAANHKPINVEKIDVVPVNIKECINKYLPKTQTNNNESLQISLSPQTL